MKNKVLYAIVSLLVLTGCGSMKNMSREDRAGVGAQIGAFVGWLFGGAVGNSIDDDIEESPVRRSLQIQATR